MVWIINSLLLLFYSSCDYYTFWFLLILTVAQKLPYTQMFYVLFFFFRSLFFVLNIYATIVGWFDCWLHLVLFVLWWCIVWWRKAILWCQNKLIMQVVELKMNLSLTSVAYNMSKIFWISWAGSASSASWQLRKERIELISLSEKGHNRSSLNIQNFDVTQLWKVKVTFLLQTFEIQTHIHYLKKAIWTNKT